MKILYIHLGFMPEELAFKLKRTLGEPSSDERSVLVITREDLADGFLYEQPLAVFLNARESYDAGQFAVSFTECGSDLVCNALTKSLQENLDFNLHDFDLGFGTKFKMRSMGRLNDEGRPYLSVLRIAQPLSAGKVSAIRSRIDLESITDIYLQFPEMGLNSTLAVKVVRGLLEGVMATFQPILAQPQYSVLFDSFGAGGSANPALQPGSLSSVDAVLHARRFLVGKAMKAKVGIRFLGDSSLCLPIYATKERKGAEAYDELQKAGRVFLLSLAGTTDIAATAIWEAQGSLKARAATMSWAGVLELMKNRVKEVQPYGLSLSSSEFVDEPMKHAFFTAFPEKAGDVNMEDDLVIRIEKSIRKISERLSAQASILLFASRVHCDPFRITEDDCQALSDFLSAKRYSLDHYVSAVLWVASGFNSQFLEKRYAHWTFADSFEDEVRKYFYPLVIQSALSDLEIVVDPFWREVGTDLLQDIIQGKAFTADFHEAWNSDLGGKLGSLFAVFGGKDAGVVDFLRSTVSAKIKKLAELLRAQLATLVDFTKVNREPIQQFLEIFLVSNGLQERAATTTSPAKYKIWARKGSWSGNIQQTADGLLPRGLSSGAVSTLSGAVVDRAFYVSSNIAALSIRETERVDLLERMRRFLERTITEFTAASFNSDALSALLQELGEKLGRSAQSFFVAAIKRNMAFLGADPALADAMKSCLQLSPMAASIDTSSSVTTREFAQTP